MKAWLVNTNSKDANGNPRGFEYMLRQSKAAAYYGRACEVDKIDKGDLVLLYHNDNRIIAVGCVVKSYDGHDFEDMHDIEHWVDTNWIWKASFDNQLNPLNPIDRRSLSINMVNGTVVNITNQINYQKLLEEIASKQDFM